MTAQDLSQGTDMSDLNDVPVPPPKNKKSWLAKVETKAEALDLIMGVTTGFWVLAGFQLLVGVVLFDFALVFDGLLNAVLAYFFRKYHSIWLAFALLVLSLLALLSTAINILLGTGGGSNIGLALIVVLVASRGVYAARELKRFSS